MTHSIKKPAHARTFGVIFAGVLLGLSATNAFSVNLSGLVTEAEHKAFHQQALRNSGINGALWYEIKKNPAKYGPERNRYWLAFSYVYSNYMWINGKNDSCGVIAIRGFLPGVCNGGDGHGDHGGDNH